MKDSQSVALKGEERAVSMVDMSDDKTVGTMVVTRVYNSEF